MDAAAAPLAQVTAPSTEATWPTPSSAPPQQDLRLPVLPSPGASSTNSRARSHPQQPEATGSANLGILFYSGGDCTGAVGSAYTLPVTELGSWKAQSITPTAPASAKSAMVRLGVEKKAPVLLQSPSAKFGAYFDDIEVLQKGIKIPNGPIIQNPTATPTPKGPVIKIPIPTATPTPKGPIIKIPIPTNTPTPPAEDLPLDDPQQDPEPDPQPQPDPEQPQQPEPQDEPEQPQDQPDQPQDEPAPSDEETTETDVPGPDLPAPDMDDDHDETPAPGNNDSGSNGGNTSGTDTPQGGDVTSAGTRVQSGDPRHDGTPGPARPRTTPATRRPLPRTPATRTTATDSSATPNWPWAADSPSAAGPRPGGFARSRRKHEDGDLYSE